MLLTFAVGGMCEDAGYRAEIRAARMRLQELESKAATGGDLTATEQNERFALAGQLTIKDPVWVLYNNVVADYEALRSGKAGTAGQPVELEKLLQLIPIVQQFVSRATSLPEAQSIANQLREFVARRDVEGAKAWAKAQ